MICGLIKTSLKQIQDERGKVMHMLRCTDQHFKGFGEVYFSWIYPEVIKAWHKHNKMILNYAVPVGSIHLVLYDDRIESPTYKAINELYMNSDDYYLLTIPNGIWYGFKAMGSKPAMIVNCATMPHDPTEIERISFNDSRIPYLWKTKHE
jgi:dTDP-4-dehydrorhamnose 3,5-epimerase